MKELHTILFMLHIVVGSAALMLFWVPIASRKGGLNHRQFGRYYRNVMYIVAASGALMAILVLGLPQTIKPELYRSNANTDALTDYIRVFWGFLLYLSLLTYLSVRQGWLALECKRDRSAVRTPLHVSLMLALCLGGMALLVSGLLHTHIMSMLFGPLGMVLSGNMLWYSFKKDVRPNEWLREHIGGFIGSGIGAYTAAIAFGGRQLFADLGYGQIVFWVLPGVIGSVLIVLMCHKYAPRTQARKEMNNA